MAGTDTTLHTPSLMCGCPACVAALGSGAAGGSGSLSAVASQPALTLSANLGQALSSAVGGVSVAAPVPVAPTLIQTVQPAASAGYLNYLPPDPNGYSYYENSFYALLAGGTNWWQTGNFHGVVQATTDGISGARHVITFSFATSDPLGDQDSHFAAMGANEQQAVRNALSYISSLFDITFKEVAPGTGDINYATNDQGSTSAGYAYYPNSLSNGSSSVFINNNSTYGYGASTDFTPGTYAWEVLIHETGHALGLKHPGNYNAGGGSVRVPYLLESNDNRGYTVMSYNNVAAGLINKPTGVASIQPSTYMSYDFQALQYLYGANTRTTSGSSAQTSGVGTVLAAAVLQNQTLSWNTDATLLETVYVIGASNAIDLTNQSLPSTIDLHAGSISSINERLTDADKLRGFSSTVGLHQYDYTKADANGYYVTHTLFDGVNDFTIAPGSQIDTVRLGSGDSTVTCNDDGDTISCGSGTDTINGGAGNDFFVLGTGSDTINGGGGTDTVRIVDLSSNYTISFSNNDTYVTLTNKRTGSVDSLSNIKTIKFNDKTLKSPPYININLYYLSVPFKHSAAVSRLFSAVDPSGSVSSYEFTLSAGATGHFQVKGVDYAAGQTVDVNQSDLSSAYYVAGTSYSYETFGVTAFDAANGTASTQQTFTLTDVAPTPPSVYSQFNFMRLLYGDTVKLNTTFYAYSGTDPISGYIVQDSATGAGAGHIRVNGVDYAPGAKVQLSVADFASAYFIAGTGNETDSLSVIAVDSTNNIQSNAAIVPITVSASLPTVIPSQGYIFPKVHQTVALSSLFGTTDRGGVITGYELSSNDSSPNGGHFRIKGVDYAAGATVDIAASDLGSAYFVAGGYSYSYVTIKALDAFTTSPALSITVDVYTADPSVVTVASNGSVPVTHLQSVAASSLFTATDPNGLAITSYQLRDLNAASSSGYFVLNGVTQLQSATVSINSLSELSQLSFQSGSGSDLISISAWNGYVWSSPAYITVAAPLDQPVAITALPPNPALRPGATIAVSSLFSATDPDSDPILYYSFDRTGSDVLYLRGVALSTDSLQISSSDLASVSVLAGNGPGTLSISAYDGFFWSQPTPVDVSGTNLSPVTTALSSTVSVSRLHSFGFSDLFAASQPQGGALTKYDFYDGTLTGSHGAIELNGVVQPAGQDVIVNASALSSLSFVGSGTDLLYARVFDGTNWSKYAKVTVTAPLDTGPVIAAASAGTPPRAGDTVPVSGLFTATSPDSGGVITEYRFYDDGTGGSRVTLGTALQPAGAIVTVASGDLASVGVVASSSADTLYIKGYDGFAWGAWTAFTVAGQNLAPVVTALSTAVSAGHLQRFGFSDLFTASDPQGSAIVKYDFYDYDLSGTGAHGAIQLNGVAQAANTDIVVTAANLSSLSFVASGSDALYARVWDGYTWGAYKKVTISGPANHAPVVATTALSTPRPGDRITVSSLFSTTDADSDPVVKYRFYDAGTGGSRLALGTALQAVGGVVDVAPGDLSSVGIVAGSGSDLLYIRAYDGVSWSSWGTVTVAGAYLPPVVTALSTAVSATHLQTFGFSDLFTASQSQGDTITRYDFYDGTIGNGSIMLNGVLQAANTDIVVTAANLSSLSFVASGSDLLYARVYDGHSWGAYKRISITAPVDQAASLIAGNFVSSGSGPGALGYYQIPTPRPGALTAASAFFTASDPDGDPITTYRFYDDGANGGRLELGGVLQAAGAVVDVAASNLGSVGVLAGTGTDTLYVKAFDGGVWSNWLAVSVNGANLAPVVTPLSAAVRAYHTQAFGFSDLFTVSDPQGSAIVKYDFYDGTLGNGSIELNNVAQAAQADIVVNASQLSSVSFVASGTDTLYVRAFDGYSWGSYQKVSVTSPTTDVPVILTIPQGAHANLGDSLTASQLFSVGDPSGRPITEYQFRQSTTAPFSIGEGYVGPLPNILSANNVPDGSTSVFDVAGTDLSSVTYKIDNGADGLSVRAFDGANWSDWTDISVKLNPGLSNFTGLATGVVTLSSTLTTGSTLVAVASAASAFDPAKHGAGFATAS